MKPLLLFLTTVTCLSSALDNQLEITSLPNSTCQLNGSINTSEGPLTLSGDAYNSCDLKIQSTNTSKILLSIITDNITASGTEYIFIERLNPLNNCSHRYVASKRLVQTCDVYFWHNTIHLHYLGNLNISIHADKTFGSSGSVGCQEDTDQDDKVGQASGCEMKGYESAIKCIVEQDWYRNSKRIRCDVRCPDNCSCVLGDREVMYSCPNRRL